MRRVCSHRAEVEGQLRLALALPSVICLNDTLLYEITRDAQLWLTGYCVLSRRNRNDWKKSGGIVWLVLERFIGHVAFFDHSTISKHRGISYTPIMDRFCLVLGIGR